MSVRIWTLPGLALVLLTTAGCFFPKSTVVKRFSGEFRCQRKLVAVEKVGDDRYVATGCNRRANYRCTGEYGELCERIGQPETIRRTEELQEAPPEGGEPAL